jgi:hypothetical protein
MNCPYDNKECNHDSVCDFYPHDCDRHPLGREEGSLFDSKEQETEPKPEEEDE